MPVGRTSTTLPTDVLRRLAAQGTSYTTPDMDVDSLSFTSGDWDGDDAVASYPNDVDDYSANFLLVPQADDERGNKSAYKLPFRESHEGAAHEGAITAIIQAINGARGGVEGVDLDTLRAAYDMAVEMGVASGLYDDMDDAPDFDPPGMEAADARIQVTRSGSDGSDAVEAADGDGLTGVVWGAGTHGLHVNGKPTEVYVPEDTVRDTFDHLQDSIEGGQPPGIGVDHFDGLAAEDVPVAADTGLLEIGEATAFSLSEDQRQIVMTDSDLTNPQAQQVAASGGFDGLDYSIVGDILLATDSEGRPQTNDDGALVVEAVRIQRVDVVDEGAVQSATVGNVPTLAAAVAARSPAANAQFLTNKLRAAAAAYDDNNTDTDMGNFDPEAFEDMSDAVEAAADVIDEKDERINELEAQVDEHTQKANAFDQIAAASGLDPTDDDVSAQDVVDAQTEDLRREIADMEASLPSYDVDDDSVEARAEDLQGHSPDELQAIRGDRATEILKTEAEYDARSTGVPAGSGRTEAAGGQQQSDEDADRIAEGVMNGQDVIQARTTDQSPSEFVQAKYGEDPADYDSEGELRAAINGGDN